MLSPIAAIAVICALVGVTFFLMIFIFDVVKKRFPSFQIPWNRNIKIILGILTVLIIWGLVQGWNAVP